MTLWQWSKKNDCWEFAAVCTEESAAQVKRGHQRRNPKGTQFRFTVGPEPPVRKYRPRAAKERAK